MYVIPVTPTESYFLQIYGSETLTAKWHFMTHYGQSIREHGPLVQYWCMRYESKHRLAKLVANVTCEYCTIRSP